MTNIKISVPNDDHVALRAMAKALEEIAVARGAPLQVNLVTEEMLEKLKETRGGNIVCEPEVDTTSQQVESLSLQKLQNLNSKTPAPAEFPQQWKEAATKVISEAVEQGAFTDSTGTPWDDRIHSASKALNADGTWRLRRKPKDMDEAEWGAYLRSIADELVSEPHGPDAGGNVEENKEIAKEINSVTLAEDEPTVTPEGDDFHTDAGVVTEQQVASFPPPPPVPQLGGGSQSTPYKLVGAGDDLSSAAGVTPQTVAITATSCGGAPVTMTFPQVMAFLTERHGRITSAQVDQIIADMGLEKITDLNTQPEHTGPFIARVKALLGE